MGIFHLKDEDIFHLGIKQPLCFMGKNLVTRDRDDEMG